MFAVLVFVVVARELDQRLDYTVYLSGLEAKRALNEVTKDHGATVDPFSLPDSPDYGGVILYVQLVGPDGTVIQRSGNLDADIPVSRKTLDQVLSSERTPKEGYSDTIGIPGERLAVYSARWETPNGRMGDALPQGQTAALAVLQIAAAEPTSERDLWTLGIVLGLVVLVATGIAAFAGWRIVATALRPVDDMSRAARAIGAEADFSRRLPPPPEPDELGRLAVTFNEMLADLERAFATQRRFLADAAHELRTPLTVVRASAETWLRGDKAEERETAARVVAREADRMGRLVADLLTLARGDANQPQVRRPVQLDAILVDVYRQALTLTDTVSLTLGEFDQVTVSGDPDRLRQLVLNLVDNAVRYTPDGGQVTLDLAQAGGSASLRVRDTGAGIPPEELPRIFDRFYRIDAARTRQSGGAGLGLAISQEIAQAHGGRIEVTSEAGHGTVFTVHLPTSDAGLV